jgi:hypothetical protein
MLEASKGGCPPAAISFLFFNIFFKKIIFKFSLFIFLIYFYNFIMIYTCPVAELALRIWRDQIEKEQN